MFSGIPCALGSPFRGGSLAKGGTNVCQNFGSTENLFHRCCWEWKMLNAKGSVLQSVCLLNRDLAGFIQEIVFKLSLSFCFWRNARLRVGWWFAVGSGSSFQLSMFTPGLFANSRSMQKGNAQLVHNPLSTATTIVCPWSFAVNVKPSTLTSSSIGHFFKN